MDPQTLAEVTVWLDQYAAASEQMKARGQAAAQAAWSTFTGWYDAALVAALAAQVADLSTSAQQASAGLAAQYVAQVVGALGGTSVRVPRMPVPAIRNGADLRLVHSRPAEVYRQAVATGAEEGRAIELAMARARNLLRSDLSLVERESEQRQMKSAGVQRFRRVLRPELSASGSCGLCIAAADRVYKTDQLMPIHPPFCKCKTMPILAGQDAAQSLNAEDITRLYAEAHDVAGSTSRKDLADVRVRVDQHGELGPVLTRAGDAFRGPTKVSLRDDPARAARELRRMLPVLTTLEQRAADGQDVAQPLQYQRDRIALLRDIAA